MSVEPGFSSETASSLWTDYFREVDHRLKPLIAERRAEIREELVAHVLDGMEAEAGDDEAARLQRVLTRLGSPSEYLDRVVGEHDGADSRTVTWKTRRALGDLGRTILLGASYLLGMMALLLAVAKPFAPDKVGLFQMPGAWWAMGYIDAEGAREVLGYWLIPLMLALVFLAWAWFPRWLARRS